MKRITLTAIILCCFTAFSGHAQETLTDAIKAVAEQTRDFLPASQVTLTEQEWNRIPPDIREKLKTLIAADNLRISETSKRREQGLTVMVEDGQYYYSVPAGSIFTQVSRDRKPPKEGNYVYSRWCDMTDIEAAYLSPAMFEMTRKLPRIDIRGHKVDLTPLVRDFKGLYMIDFPQFRKGDPTVRYCRNTTAGGLRKDIRDFLDTGHYTTLMDVRKDGQYIRLYTSSRGDTVTGFTLVNLDDSFDYGRFICLEGEMPKEAFNKIMAKVIE